MPMHHLRGVGNETHAATTYNIIFSLSVPISLSTSQSLANGIETELNKQQQKTQPNISIRFGLN